MSSSPGETSPGVQRKISKSALQSQSSSNFHLISSESRDTIKNKISTTFSIAKLFVVVSFYLWSNFAILFLPACAYIAVFGFGQTSDLIGSDDHIINIYIIIVYASRFFWLIVFIDYLIPMKLPGMSWEWCRLTDDTVGKENYFDVDIIWEFDDSVNPVTGIGRCKNSTNHGNGNANLNNNMSETSSVSTSASHNSLSSTVSNSSTSVTSNSLSGCNSPVKRKSHLSPQFNKSINYLFCYHPHSLFGIAYNIFVKELYQRYGVHMLFTGADIVGKLPIIRRILCWWGYTSCSGTEMRKNMKLPYPSNCLTLMPGGIAEMFYGTSSEPHERIVLRKRGGFCKIALQQGTPLVPVYVMGANQVYTRWFNQNSLAAKISSKIQCSLVFWTDRFHIPYGFIPYPEKLVVIVGHPVWYKPLKDEEIPQPIDNPTNEQINDLQDKYINALRDLFDRHKWRKGAEWSKKLLLLEDDDAKDVMKECQTMKID